MNHRHLSTAQPSPTRLFCQAGHQHGRVPPPVHFVDAGERLDLFGSQEKRIGLMYPLVPV